MPACACGHHHPDEGCGRPDPVGGQVALSGHISCADAGQLMVLLTHVQSHVAASRAEPGCLQLEISQTSDPLIWRIDGLFRDSAALEAHRARIGNSPWAAATTGIPREVRVFAAGGEAVAATV